MARESFSPAGASVPSADSRARNTFAFVAAKSGSPSAEPSARVRHAAAYDGNVALRSSMRPLTSEGVAPSNAMTPACGKPAATSATLASASPLKFASRILRPSRNTWFPFVATHVRKHAESPEKSGDSQSKPRPVAGPTRMPASMAWCIAARVRGGTASSPQGSSVRSMSARMSLIFLLAMF